MPQHADRLGGSGPPPSSRGQAAQHAKKTPSTEGLPVRHSHWSTKRGAIAGLASQLTKGLNGPLLARR